MGIEYLTGNHPGKNFCNRKDLIVTYCAFREEGLCVREM